VPQILVPPNCLTLITHFAHTVSESYNHPNGVGLAPFSQFGAWRLVKTLGAEIHLRVEVLQSQTKLGATIGIFGKVILRFVSNPWKGSPCQHSYHPEILGHLPSGSFHIHRLM
jgi:hypothetical protein